MNIEKIKEWIKSHKREIIIGGCCVVGVVICYKYGDKIYEFGKSLLNRNDGCDSNKIISDTATIVELPIKSIEVSGHVRNLPIGCHPSIRQITLAATKEIELSDTQTYVSSYNRCCYEV